MARFRSRRAPISIVGLLAALIILYILYHQGYLGHSNILTPPRMSP